LEGFFSDFDYSDFALVDMITCAPNLTRCCTPKKGKLLFGEATWDAGSRSEAIQSFSVQVPCYSAIWNPDLCRWLPRDYGRPEFARLLCNFEGTLVSIWNAEMQAGWPGSRKLLLATFATAM
jgi:hypothetical protein